MRSKLKVLMVSLSIVSTVPFVAIAQKKSTFKQVISQPNIIVILSDDQGWGATSVLMDKDVEASRSDFVLTPNLEKLAACGVIFSNGYAASPNCSPTRASILTGKSPAQLKLTDIIERDSGPLYIGNKLIPSAHIDGLPYDEVTIAEFIKSKRPEYTAAHFGKWHLGNGGPAKHGFDESDGQTSNREGNLKKDGNPKDIFGVTSRAINWMDKQVASKKPFYLQLSHYATHLGMESKAETIDKTKNRKPGERHNDVRFAAMSEDLDDGIGLLLAEIKRLGIAENTYIIYLSDNGSHSTKNPGNINGPLHGWKATTWEGGIRVPFFIAGPGIKPARSSATAVSYDLFPTICEWLGIDGLPKGIEGGSLVNALKNPTAQKSVSRDNDFIVFHFPHYQLEKGSQPSTAIIKGDYKLIKFYENQSFYLFNLKDDLSEQVNLATQKPDVVKELSRLMDGYLTKIDAILPVKNNDYTIEKDPGQKFLRVKNALLEKPYFIPEKLKPSTAQ